MSASLQIACYFPAEDPEFFAINIQSRSFVGQLVSAVHAELKLRHREVDFTDLRLYKTNILLTPLEDLQMRALQWLHQQPGNSYLNHAHKLATVFPEVSGDLDIVIACPEVLELTEGLGDPYDAYKRKIKKALNQRLNDLSPSASPSEIIHNPKKLAKLLGGDETHIHQGEVPAAIFNPALATLQNHLDHLEQVDVSRVEVDHAARYLHCAVTFYEDETVRQMAIRKPMEDAIGMTGVWDTRIDWAENVKPECCWWYTEFLTRILGLKNTLGLTGDAVLQAVIGYSKIISREKYKPFREFCNFPIVLVGATANRLEVSIAVCVGSIYVTRLLTLDFSLGFFSSDNILRLARVFKALSLCQVDLEDYYDGVIKSTRLSCLYPNPTCVDLSKTLPKLTYLHFLARSGQPTSVLPDLGHTTTALYIATLNDQQVVVKFTARYNAMAHRLLAEAELAPKLHFCERVIGGIYMVVMDHVDGKSIWQLLQDKTPVPEIVMEKVEKAMLLLHEQDIVFGDLRDPNILVVSEGEGVFLVDFDWPGMNGVSRYPGTLNPQNTWAEDVVPYGVMRKSHDLWQVNRLRALFLPHPPPPVPLIYPYRLE